MASRDLVGLFILALPPLFWAGNFVVGRATRFDLPPVTLAFGRWLIAISCLLNGYFQSTKKRRPASARRLYISTSYING